MYNKARGLDISCGCFSTSEDEASESNLYLLRDFSFIVIAVYLFIKVFISDSVRHQAFFPNISLTYAINSYIYGFIKL